MVSALRILNLMQKHGPQVLFGIVDRLNAGDAQRDIARSLGMDPSQFSRDVIGSLVEKRWVLTESTLSMLDTLKTIMGAQIERERGQAGKLHSLEVGRKTETRPR